MGTKSLHAFIAALERRGELLRVAAPVSAELEITRIADLCCKQQGPALLFENVIGSRYPLLINAFASCPRMSLALGVAQLDDLGAQVGDYLNLTNYASIKNILRFIPKLWRLAGCFALRLPRLCSLFFRPACQQVIERDVNLNTLPVLKCWPLDGGRFFTLPLVFTKPPHSRAQNCGMYRMQILDQTSTAMHWHKHKDGTGMFEQYRAKGERMPVSVAIGPSPACTYAATAPLPPGVDEMMLAGFINRKPVVLVKCVTNELYVPADSQIVLEGYVDPNEEPVLEGPFGDHTGYYSLEDYYPRFHVMCITHRKNAVYQATVVGPPPMEDCFLAKATERMFLPALRFQIPQLIDLNLPLEGVFHNCAVVSVKNSYPGAARTVMSALWGAGQMRYTKMIVAVGESVNPHDLTAVLGAVLARVNFERDLVYNKGPLDALDHSSAETLFGTRLGIDATGINQGGADSSNVNGAVRVVAAEKRAAGDGLRAALAALESAPCRIAVAVDHTEDITNAPLILWRVFNNIDAGRDLAVKNGRLAVDATRKLPEEGLTRPWPEDILMTEDIINRVNKRWNEYGFK